MAFQNGKRLTNLFQLIIPAPTEELLERVPTHLKNSYARDFHLADRAFQAGRLEATTRGCQIILGPLAGLHEPSGSGPISSGYKLLNANANPFRIHGARSHRILW